MMGEPLHVAEIGPGGMVGDRWWAVRDEVRGGIRGAKKIGDLMKLSAAYLGEPVSVGTPPAIRIGLPDGATVDSTDDDVDARLSAALDHEVTLHPLRPAADTEHYRRGAPDSDDVLVELRDLFGRTEDEPLPDLSVFPPEIFEYESPLGTYFDAFPLLVMTQQSLDTVASLAPGSRADVRRFRPNLLIDVPDSGVPFPEQSWVGRTISVGEVELDIVTGCPRCVMVTRGFDDLPEDRDILRTIVGEADQLLGVYATVRTPGEVAVGAAVVGRTDRRPRARFRSTASSSGRPWPLSTTSPSSGAKSGRMNAAGGREESKGAMAMRRVPSGISGAGLHGSGRDGDGDDGDLFEHRGERGAAATSSGCAEACAATPRTATSGRSARRHASRASNREREAGAHPQVPAGEDHNGPGDVVPVGFGEPASIDDAGRNGAATGDESRRRVVQRPYVEQRASGDPTGHRRHECFHEGIEPGLHHHQLSDAQAAVTDEVERSEPGAERNRVGRQLVRIAGNRKMLHPVQPAFELVGHGRGPAREPVIARFPIPFIHRTGVLSDFASLLSCEHAGMPLHPATAAALDGAVTPFEVVDCDPHLADTAAFCEAYGYDPADSANVDRGRGQVEPAGPCVLRGPGDASARRERHGQAPAPHRKASFAPFEAGESLTGMTSGGITPIGLSSMPVWVDAAVMDRSRVVVGGGTRDTKVVTPPALLVELGAEVVDGLASEVS